MLNSNLLISNVFNVSAVPYNITWYDSTTGKEMTNQTSRILVRGETLWFLNVTEEDAGKYVTTVRYSGSKNLIKISLGLHSSRGEAITLPFSQDANMVLQTVYQTGGGATY